MRRRTIGLATIGFLGFALVIVATGFQTTSGVAQDGVEATATRTAEVAELTALRTQVAVLSTEVANRGGEPDALVARLGGFRAGFDETLGAPTAFIASDQVMYERETGERVTVTFENDRAARVVVTSPRPENTSLTESDSADWSLAEAREIAASYAPADTELTEPVENEDGSGLVASGTSQDLAAPESTPAAAACVTEGAAGQFEVVFTTPTAETVSAITLTTTGEASSAAAPAPRSPDRSTRGGRTVAASSLPGTTTVNGIQVRGIQARDDPDRGSEPGTLAVELAIENQTDGTLRVAPEHLVLVDEDEREISAVCDGEEPSIAGVEIAAGDSAEGWANFVIPEDFAPDQFAYFVNGESSTRVVFILN